MTPFSLLVICRRTTSSVLSRRSCHCREKLSLAPDLVASLKKYPLGAIGGMPLLRSLFVRILGPAGLLEEMLLLLTSIASSEASPRLVPARGVSSIPNADLLRTTFPIAISEGRLSAVRSDLTKVRLPSHPPD